MTKKELMQQCKSIIETGIEEFKQDPILDEEDKIMLDTVKAAMIAKYYSEISETDESEMSFILENSDAYLNMLKLAIASMNDEVTELDMAKAALEYINRFNEWMANKENE